VWVDAAAVAAAVAAAAVEPAGMEVEVAVVAWDSAVTHGPAVEGESYEAGRVDVGEKPGCEPSVQQDVSAEAEVGVAVVAAVAVTAAVHAAVAAVVGLMPAAVVDAGTGCASAVVLGPQGFAAVDWLLILERCLGCWPLVTGVYEEHPGADVRLGCWAGVASA
jgi:hypothetical protein